MSTVTEKELDQFIGTTRYHRLTAVPMNCTDGVAYFAEKANAFWLINDISIRCHYSEMKNEPFIVIKVTTHKNRAAAEYSDGNGKVLFVERYFMTDLEGNYTFYLTDNVLMLPSEY